MGSLILIKIMSCEEEKSSKKHLGPFRSDLETFVSVSCVY